MKTPVVAPFSASVLQHLLDRQLEHSIGTARNYLVEHRKAQVADELYTHLSGLSDAELARRGLKRQDLPQFIKEHLYSS